MPWALTVRSERHAFDGRVAVDGSRGARHDELAHAGLLSLAQHVQRSLNGRLQGRASALATTLL